jgi:hypothetical protein
MNKTEKNQLKKQSLLPWSLILIVGLIIVDQIVKHWVTSNIPLNGSRTFIPGLLDLDNLHNTGAAWSMLEGRQWLFCGHNGNCNYRGSLSDVEKSSLCLDDDRTFADYGWCSR